MIITSVVTGFMRTGSSMMMDALSNGGLEPVYNSSRDKMNIQHGDEYYQPNPNGFYELSREEYQQFGFPKMYEGKLIKLLFQGLHRLAVADYRIVFMKRDPEEIRQSYEAFFGRKAKGIKGTLNNYEALASEAIRGLHNRKDVLSVHVFSYREVVENPLAHFEILVADGWPIDPVSAASVVDPKLCRFKIEHLDVGI